VRSRPLARLVHLTGHLELPWPKRWTARHGHRKKSPLARYLVPWRSYAAVLAFAVLPTRLMDWLMRSIMGLSRL
jgi:hypothetical protein